MLVRGFEPVIGIEIHVQLSTKSKLFCSDSTEFGCPDNENTSPISIGMPGALPVLNRSAVLMAIKAGLALNCKINSPSVFARKNYFYPDLPKGYQISQFDLPICSNGKVEFFVGGNKKNVTIQRAHLEEDAGKSIHQAGMTLLNYNRAGIPLLEIVTGPDMHSPEEAAEYGRTIRQIVRYINVCDGNLEEGSLRCDINISVRKPGEKLGQRVELKNINSFRFVEKAVEYEIHRQIDLLEKGQQVTQETRLWDADKNKTVYMRSKENAEDYRYFPDPDLLPLHISEIEIQEILKSLPELPLTRKHRFVSDYGLTESESEILTREKEIADFFETTISFCDNPKATANWILVEVLREIKEQGLEFSCVPITPTHLGNLIKLIDSKVISGKIAKVVFLEMWKTGDEPQMIVERNGLRQVVDHSEIEKCVDQVLAENQQLVADYISGKKQNAFGFFVGAVMKASKGKANPDIVNKLLNDKIKKV